METLPSCNMTLTGVLSPVGSFPTLHGKTRRATQRAANRGMLQLPDCTEVTCCQVNRLLPRLRMMGHAWLTQQLETWKTLRKPAMF